MRKIIKLFIATILATALISWPELLQSRAYRQIVDVANTATLPMRHTVSQIMPTPTPIPLDQTKLIELVNQLRAENQLPALKIGKQTCALLDLFAADQAFSKDEVFTTCPSCARAQFISITQPVNQSSVRQVFDQDATAAAVIKDKKLTHICSQINDDNAYLVFVEARASEISSKSIATPIKEISEDELWQAFQNYRKSQGKNELVRDENICTYARKRVQDHLTLKEKNQPPESYPVPAKYPLDAHDGFKKDADSSLVFEMTHKNEVAENLAYWPSALYAVHVIEWGWDTSTEGHREAQLSTEWSAACLTGKQGFYVAIFGK